MEYVCPLNARSHVSENPVYIHKTMRVRSHRSAGFAIHSFSWCIGCRQAAPAAKAKSRNQQHAHKIIANERARETETDTEREHYLVIS